jgi:predicted nucleotidyltransferase
MTVKQAKLNEVITESLSRIANPQQLILFGSQARGTANQDSDVDLLVIASKDRWKTSSRLNEISRLRRALPRIGFPVDILLFTPSEVEHWRNAQNHVVYEALHHGVVLYERP